MLSAAVTKANNNNNKNANKKACFRAKGCGGKNAKQKTVE